MKSHVFLFILSLFITNIANSNIVSVKFASVFTRILNNPNIPVNHKHLMGDQLIRKLLRSNSKPELRKELMHRKEQLLLESTKKTVIDGNNNKKYDIE